MPDKLLQTWRLTLDGREHRVEVSGGSIVRRLSWYVDNRLVVATKSAEEKVKLEPGPDDVGLGTIALRFAVSGAPRRATWSGSDGLPGVGADEIDLEPDPGSAAEAYEDRLRAHPRRHALIGTVGGVAKVVVPVVLTLLLARLALSIDWPWSTPDLPDLPSPDLPSIPWPDLPSIPWPDITLPGWLRWLLEHAKYVVPVLIAFGLAQAEIRRRRAQDRLRAERRRTSDDAE